MHLSISEASVPLLDLRNVEMLGAAVTLAGQLGEQASVLLLAFPGGKGTSNGIRQTRKLRRIGGHPIGFRFARA